ncbi:MAG: hypothetical protein HZA24_04680 [Nitrospirae bacterium]|nr:hypothetical protein [Nitrospirota bacterium]
MMFYLARGLQLAGLVGVGAILYLNLWPQGITMATMLKLLVFSVLLFLAGTTLLKSE